jgi:hypothetical protein
MTGRQGPFRARAMPNGVLSQGRGEGEDCPRGGGVGSAATLQCCSVGERLTPRAFPSGPIRKNDVPTSPESCAGQCCYCTGSTINLHCSARARLVLVLRLRRRLRLSQTRAAINCAILWVPPSSQVVMVRAGLRAGSPDSRERNTWARRSSVVTAPGPGGGHYLTADRARICGGFGLQRKKAIIDGDGQGARVSSWWWLSDVSRWGNTRRAAK